MLLVGGLTTAVTSLLARLAARRDHALPARLLVAARGRFPAWWLMRIAAQWIYDKEGFSGDRLRLDRDRLHHGRGRRPLAADRDHPHRHRRAPDAERRDGGAEHPGAVGAVLATIVLAAYLVAVWAMTAKPD